MTGGSEYEPLGDSMSTTELVDMNGTTSGPDLPADLTDHCIAKMNTSHSIIIGGLFEPVKTFVIHSDTFEMTKGPDLTCAGRYDLGCAHIRHKNGSNYVIAAGGNYGHNGLDTSEILNVNSSSNHW